MAYSALKVCETVETAIGRLLLYLLAFRNKADDWDKSILRSSVQA
jgi:hypothetical protein